MRREVSLCPRQVERVRVSPARLTTPRTGSQECQISNSSYVGIGLAIANYLLKDSAKHNLVILGGRSQEALDKLKAQSPQRIELIPGDLSDFSLSQNAVDIAISAFGKVDGLIINHGILGEVARIADCDPAGIRKTFDVNFFSAIACVS